MRFTNTLRLLMGNFKQALHLFLSKAITAIVVIALCSAFILPELLEIAEDPVTQTLVENFKNIFKSFVDHDLGHSPFYYIYEVFSEGGALSQFFGLLFNMPLYLILVAVGCILVYLIKCFVDEVMHFTVGHIVNDKMSTYAQTPFGTAFVANLAKASNYAWLYTLVVFFVDILTIAIIWVFLRFMPLLFALFLGMTLLVAIQALKLTFTGSWMPAMTADNKKLKEVIFGKDAYEKRHLFKTFMLYAVLIYLVVIVNVVAALCTFGSALLITVPTSYLLFICAQYVNYYTTKGKKYFITYEDIATNPDHGDHANFFNYVESVENHTNNQELNEENK